MSGVFCPGGGGGCYVLEPSNFRQLKSDELFWSEFPILLVLIF